MIIEDNSGQTKRISDKTNIHETKTESNSQNPSNKLEFVIILVTIQLLFSYYLVTIQFLFSYYLVTIWFVTILELFCNYLQITRNDVKVTFQSLSGISLNRPLQVDWVPNQFRFEGATMAQILVSSRLLVLRLRKKQGAEQGAEMKRGQPRQ